MCVEYEYVTCYVRGGRVCEWSMCLAVDVNGAWVWQLSRCGVEGWSLHTWALRLVSMSKYPKPSTLRAGGM